MDGHRKYEKVERWDKTEEIDGINIGTIHIFEKIDGANAQCFQDEEGYLRVGKRTQLIARAKNEEGCPFEIGDSFRGLPEHIFKHAGIRKLLKSNPRLWLHGEWLVKHTVNYDPYFQNKFWVFDVFDSERDRYLPYNEYHLMLQEFDVGHILLMDIKENPSMDELLDLVRKDEQIPRSHFGATTIEGLVFKNYDFTNKWGRCAYMKAVTKDFREVHPIVMGTTGHDPVEAYLVAKYQTPARMNKIWNKLVDDHGILSMRNVKEFMERTLYDLFVEESWNMFIKDKKARGGTFDMRKLRKASAAGAKNWFIAKLQEEIGNVNTH